MISLIVAYDQNRGIGKNNSMPWNYPEDMKYFRQTTEGFTVAMGRNTFESIGRALPKRKNIVFTRDASSLNNMENITIETNPLKFFQEMQRAEEEIFVIGGSKIYEQALPYANRLYITHINKSYDVDKFFPKVDFTKFNKISEKTNGDLTFAVYERKFEV